MDKKVENIFKINKVLEKANISNEGYNSMDVGFFARDSEQKLFEVDFKEIKPLPKGLNCSVKSIYEILGNMETEIYIGEWTIMTITRALEIYEEYKKSGRENVFDFGFRYMGMGHIEVVSCDLDDFKIFFHPAGGSNGYDREDNFNDIVKNGPQKYSGSKINFDDWFYKIETNIEEPMV
jgi:hypothetical protein